MNVESLAEQTIAEGSIRKKALIRENGSMKRGYQQTAPSGMQAKLPQQ